MGARSLTERLAAIGEVKVGRAAVQQPAGDPRQQTIEYWLSHAAPRFRGARLTEWDSAPDAADPSDHAAMLEDVRTWVSIGKGTLLVAGPVGVGKTHLAAGVCRELAGYGRWCEMVSLLDLVEDNRPGNRRRGMAHWVGADVLLLDDVGAGRSQPSEFVAECLDALADGRWRNGRTTIITTNLGVERSADGVSAFAAYVGQRTADRLLDGALAIVVTGQSRRARNWESEL